MKLIPSVGNRMLEGCEAEEDRRTEGSSVGWQLRKPEEIGRKAGGDTIRLTRKGKAEIAQFSL